MSPKLLLPSETVLRLPYANSSTMEEARKLGFISIFARLFIHSTFTRYRQWPGSIRGTEESLTSQGMNSSSNSIWCPLIHVSHEQHTEAERRCPDIKHLNCWLSKKYMWWPPHITILPSYHEWPTYPTYPTMSGHHYPTIKSSYHGNNNI